MIDNILSCIKNFILKLIPNLITNIEVLKDFINSITQFIFVSYFILVNSLLIILLISLIIFLMLSK